MNLSDLKVPPENTKQITKLKVPPENTKQITKSKIDRGPLGKVAPILSLFSTVAPPSDYSPSRSGNSCYMVTVGISHYCEKARWCMDLMRADKENDFDYYESAHVPGLAALYTTALDGGVSATPIVKFADGEVVWDSTQVMDKVVPKAFEEEGGREIEEWMDEKLGSGTRCYAYYHLLGGDPELLTELATDQTSWVESKIFGLMARKGMIQPGMKKFMGIDKEAMEDSEATIRRVFDEIGEKIEEGDGDFIIGDR
jgi:glutathione S-transferase